MSDQIDPSENGPLAAPDGEPASGSHLGPMLWIAIPFLLIIVLGICMP